jgi:hypothetical protein
MPASHRFGPHDPFRATAGGPRTVASPETLRRIALALGDGSIEDARHLLPPLAAVAAPAARLELPEGPDAATHFVVTLSGSAPVPLQALAEAFDAVVRAELDFPRLWASPSGADADRGAGPWIPLPLAVHPDQHIGAHLPVRRLALAWPLTALAAPEPERQLSGYFAGAAVAVREIGWSTAANGEPPAAAVVRAARLNRIKARFARALEMRLVAIGAPFPAREVWRALYSLGLTWGDMDLFHWDGGGSGDEHRFTVSALGQPGTFLPERAAQGQRVPGLVLGFELPSAVAPIETYDRMAVALDYLRQRLGGRPAAADGSDLDADRLFADRDALDETLRDMNAAGIPPGSWEAARIF